MSGKTHTAPWPPGDSMTLAMLMTALYVTYQLWSGKKAEDMATYMATIAAVLSESDILQTYKHSKTTET